MSGAVVILEPSSGHAASLLSQFARLEGRPLAVFHDLAEGLAAASREDVALVVFDTAVCEADPLWAARLLRQETSAHLLVLTAEARDLKRLRRHAAELSLAAVLVPSTPVHALHSFIARLLEGPRPVIRPMHRPGLYRLVVGHARPPRSGAEGAGGAGSSRRG